MPYDKVGQESSGPIGLYDEDQGSGRPWIARRCFASEGPSDGWSAEGRQSAPQVCTESVS